MVICHILSRERCEKHEAERKLKDEFDRWAYHVIAVTRVACIASATVIGESNKLEGGAVSPMK